MFKNILLPYDGSNPSDKALDYAVKFASDIKNNMLVTLLRNPRNPFASQLWLWVKITHRKDLKSYIKIWDLML